MVDNNSFETVSGETSAEFDHHEEDNILELVFAEEIYSSNFHYDLSFYLHNHPLCELNTDLYDVFKEFVNEEIETFIGISFYYSYGLAVLTFLDKIPNTCIEQFKKISESERIVCSSFAILYGLLLKRKGNSKIVESFIKSLRRELTIMENRIGWTGLSNGIQDEIGSQEKKIMNFHPVGLEWTLDEIESFDKEYFLNQYPIKSVSIKLIEHILRTADTIKEQKKAYKLIVKSLESIYNDGHCEKSVFYHLKNNLKVLSRTYTVGEDSVQKYEIRLPNMWWNEIDRGNFGNYHSLSATNNTSKREQTKEEIKLSKCRNDKVLTGVPSPQLNKPNNESLENGSSNNTDKNECATDITPENVEKPLIIQINTKQRNILEKAEKSNIIKYNAERKGYDNGEHTSNVLVAYLCGRIFCGDYTKNGIWIAGKRFDDAKYCNDLFGFDVAATRRSSRSTGQGKSPIGYDKIDDFLKKISKSKQNDI